VCNTACFLASRAGRTEVAQADLVAAVEQTKYGKTYEASKFVSPGRKQRFAVVEAGFCVAAALLPAIEPIDYVTILPSIKSPVGRTVLKVWQQKSWSYLFETQLDTGRRVIGLKAGCGQL
jgi:ATP-dependent Zn protease